MIFKLKIVFDLLIERSYQLIKKCLNVYYLYVYHLNVYYLNVYHLDVYFYTIHRLILLFIDLKNVFFLFYRKFSLWMLDRIQRLWQTEPVEAVANVPSIIPIVRFNS